WYADGEHEPRRGEGGDDPEDTNPPPAHPADVVPSVVVVVVRGGHLAVPANDPGQDDDERRGCQPHEDHGDRARRETAAQAQLGRRLEPGTGQSEGGDAGPGIADEVGVEAGEHRCTRGEEGDDGQTCTRPPEECLKREGRDRTRTGGRGRHEYHGPRVSVEGERPDDAAAEQRQRDRKSTRLNSSHVSISYAVFCLKKKNKRQTA